ncbi:hypothetical protein DFP73DRAFT_555684 [Morchella snyderi]|nr:hypothetical protein DFP73DRAFT_555684 [Morchella snyderi]
MTGYFTFKWAYPAGEVYVTGTFDNWGKSTKLEKEGEAFVAKVELPVEKTLYKFVVDGNWVVDHTARKEFENGIENNLLIPEDIVPEQSEESNMSAATINSAAPESTTAALAAAVPLENTPAVSTPGPADVPGGFIETPAVEKEAQEFSVKPLPASDTATNPFNLAPGQPIPANDVTTQDINKHVKLDEESYEKADASNLGFGLNGAPILPDVVTPAAQREAEGRGVLDIPIVTGNTIPESSLPITSTAAATAAPEVPEIVKESQEKAEVEPEASAIPEVVEQKKEVEEELKTETSKVESNTTVAGIMAAAGIASASGEPNEETTPAFVPEIVRDSQKVAQVAPEASAVEAAVEAKKEVEQELLHDAPSVTLNAVSTQHAVPEPTVPAAEVPAVVQKSLVEADTLSEAAGVSESVELKKEFEQELKTDDLSSEPVIVLRHETVPSKTENGFMSNGNATEVKSEKETEANGNGLRSPKKSLENGDNRELKTKRKSFLGSLKEFLHLGSATKEKGKAKGENHEGRLMLRNAMVFLAVIVSAFWLFLALLNSMGWRVASTVTV